MKRLDNPPNPDSSIWHEWLEPPPAVQVEVYEERSRSILSENDSPDIGHRWSVNPYRGCQHACSYCYARPTHEYLGFGAGTDFDTRLVVKVGAPQLLEKAFRLSRWQGEPIAFSGATDCYQPLEVVYGLTRACLDVCVAFRNPAEIATKSYLVVRDADVLAELSRVASACVMFSIGFADAETCRLIEPGAPPPDRRFEAMRRLAEAGVPVGILTAPIIPGLNDRDIPELLQRAADCGATRSAYTALRLNGSVESVFLGRLGRTMPLRYDRVVNRLREIRGGKLGESRFGERMRGRGVYWDSIERLYEVSARRWGLHEAHDLERCGCTFRVPPDRRPQSAQLELPFG